MTYTHQFGDIEGSQYILTITTPEGSGTSTLLLSGEPITIDYNLDKDIFKPCGNGDFWVQQKRNCEMLQGRKADLQKIQMEILNRSHITWLLFYGRNYENHWNRSEFDFIRSFVLCQRQTQKLHANQA